MVELWIHRKCAREGDELVNVPKQSSDSQCELCTVQAGKVWLHEGREVAESIPDLAIEEARAATGSLVEGPEDKFIEEEAGNVEAITDDAEMAVIDAVEETIEELGEEAKTPGVDAPEDTENHTPENDTGEVEEAVEEVSEEEPETILAVGMTDDGNYIAADGKVYEAVEESVEAESEPSVTIAVKVDASEVLDTLSELDKQIAELQAKKDALEK